MAAPFRLTAITNDPQLAAACDRAGVDRIGVDIERLKKRDRQGHIRNTRISDHNLRDLDRLRSVVRRAQLFARINPICANTQSEIEEAIERGAHVLMLPYFQTAAEVERFVRIVDGRAIATLLLEHISAVVRLHEILAVGGIAEIVIGLNDLSLSCGLPNSFEMLGSDLMASIAHALRARGVPFGFGGVARAGDENLPIPADYVFAQHARLGSRAAWLSRSFFGTDPLQLNMDQEISRLRARLDWWTAQPSTIIERNLSGMRLIVARMRP